MATPRPLDPWELPPPARDGTNGDDDKQGPQAELIPAAAGFGFVGDSSHRWTLQLGRACWNRATPSSVTGVRSRYNRSSSVKFWRSPNPASVTLVCWRNN